MSHFDYIAELDGPQGRVDVSGRRLPGKGNSLVGALIGAAAGFATGGFSLMGTAVSAVQAAGLGATLGSTLLGGQGEEKQPAQQAVQQTPTVPESQAAKAPTSTSIQQGVLGIGQAGGAPGAASTLLTGPGGIDPSKLNLGKNTLLGQ